MLIRTQDNVPEIYVNDSRDFQVLCRAYDVLFNMIKFDIDSMTKVLSAADIRSNVLPLLQQKLGFFTDKTIDDDSLRMVLGAFPILLKGKGSLRSIKQAINVWLKIAHLETSTEVSIFTKEGGRIGQIEMPPYTVAIGINSKTKDLTTLKEILKYIIPTGFGMYFYFYYGLDITEQNYQNIFEDKAVVAFVSDDINSVVRGSSSDVRIPNAELSTEGKIFTTVISTAAYGSEVNPTDVFENTIIPGESIGGNNEC